MRNLILILGFIGTKYVLNVAAKALQLVAPDSSHTKLVPVEETLATLREIEAPLAVVSIVGSVHSGKSSFLNRLMGQASGFGVGYTVDPKTAGIWMWSEPIKFEGTSILLLDTEGFHGPNVTTNYDSKIFSISALLSNEIIYNTVKFIDQQNIEHLELILRQASLFGLRAHAWHKRNMDKAETSSIGSQVSNLMPSRLSWVAQDFVQDLQGWKPKDWLVSLLEAADDRAKELHGTTDDASGLLDFFKNIDCLTLPPPTGDNEALQRIDLIENRNLNPEYVNQVKIFQQRLFHRCAKDPKKKIQTVVSGRNSDYKDKTITINGSDLADLIVYLTNSVNRESTFVNVPTIWENFSTLQASLARNDIQQLYEADLREYLTKSFPLSQEQFLNESESLKTLVLETWKSTASGLHNPKEVAANEKLLLENLRKIQLTCQDENCRKIAVLCESASNTALTSAHRRISKQLESSPLDLERFDIDLGTEREATQKEQKKLLEKDHSRYHEEPCCQAELQEFEKKMQNIFTEASRQNARAVEDYITGAIEEYRKYISEKLKLEKSALQNSEVVFRGLLSQWHQTALSNFDSRIQRLSTVPAALSARHLLDSELKFEIKQSLESWKEKCHEQCQASIESARKKFAINVNRKVSRPCIEEALADAIQDQTNLFISDFEEVYCRGSDTWKTNFSQLRKVLAELAQSLEKENVKMIKNLSKTSLDFLFRRLEVQAQNYYVWPQFENLVRKEGSTALAYAASQQELQLSSRLMERVLQSFIDEDCQDLRRIIWTNLLTLLSSLGLKIIFFIWSASALRNRKWRSLLISSISLAVVFTFSSLTGFLNKAIASSLDVCISLGSQFLKYVMVFLVFIFVVLFSNRGRKFLEFCAKWIARLQGKAPPVTPVPATFFPDDPSPNECYGRGPPTFAHTPGPFRQCYDHTYDPYTNYSRRGSSSRRDTTTAPRYQ
eukprot:GHVP01023779.1.p1 GENE.GHVP01023779.1~~GHVP01023779.1.p1  ORF type:complete len:962 (+),score=167.04 GHVP01023779.1:26-2887(+)